METCRSVFLEKVARGRVMGTCTNPIGLCKRESCYENGRACGWMKYVCPKCLGNKRHQEIDPTGWYSFLVCEECGYVEFDD